MYWRVPKENEGLTINSKTTTPLAKMNVYWATAFTSIGEVYPPYASEGWGILNG